MPRFATVPLSRIFLFLENPRHEPMEDEKSVIEYLCTHEDVYPLARDIAINGLNPLEILALIPANSNKGHSESYIVPEGNRRICALKLLNDPALSPSNLKKSFEKLSKKWARIRSVSAVIFEDYEETKIWLERLHNGAQDGIGRRQWKSIQKARFDETSKNRYAQSLLDYGKQEKMATHDSLEDKLTTTQRFIGIERFREIIGIVLYDGAVVGRNRPKDQFDSIISLFFRDLIEDKTVKEGKKVHSRMNKDEIIAYAQSILAESDIEGSRISPEELIINFPTQYSDEEDSNKKTEGEENRKTKRKKPRPKPPNMPEFATSLSFDQDIWDLLSNLNNEKLLSFYYSMCSIELKRHTPTVCVGVWAFFETLTAFIGRNQATSFDSFLSKAKLSTLGIVDDTKPYTEAIIRIRAYGNTTKHDKISATFNGDQLYNDMNLLKPLIVGCLKEAIAST